ncbi:MAG: tail fiber domain-containing protein [Chitinophagaceae bacterium]|nr:tail fiber domain-containing protein [Chitinophagaceae bacterium]
MKEIFTPGYFLLIFFILCLQEDLFSQNVGIGISNPTRAKLEVNGAVDYTTAIFGGESTGIGIIRNNPGIGFNNYYNGGNRYIANGYSGAIWLDAVNGGMFFDVNGFGTANSLATSGINSMVINNSGNIGIRSSGYPDISLFVPRQSNNSGALVIGGTTYNSRFYYGTAEDTYITAGKDNGHLILNHIPGGHVIMGSGTTRVSINNGVPLYTLEIRQANQKGIALISPENLFDVWEMRTWNTGGNPGSLCFNYNGVWKSFIYIDGAYVQVSDKRLKKDIKPVPALLGKIMRLNPVTYAMKQNNPDNEISYGFIAQEVKDLFPELVHITKDTSNGYGISDLHMMNYSGFGVLAIKAIQEQQQQLTEMRKEIDLLKEQNKMLLQLINRKN